MGHYNPAATAGTSLDVVREEPVIVKPAAPTERTTVYLHNIDQQVFFHLELLFIYDVAKEQQQSDQAERLRNALAKVLVPYSFAAGRFRVNEDEGRLELDCNGEGVLFASARCNSTIKELGDLRVLNPDLRKLLVYPTGVKKIEDIPLFTVQVTRFKCGGVIMGIYTHHIAFDGVSGGDFFINFGRAAMGEPLLLDANPTPDRTCLRTRTPPRTSFDHKEMMQLPDVPAKLLFNPASYDPQAPLKHATKIFPFTSQMLSELKKKALEDGMVSRCSTFEALAAHIWKARTLAACNPLDNNLAKLFIAMEIRQKLKEHPLPRNYSGNAVIAAPCFDATVAEICSEPLSFAVRNVQKAIGMVNEEYIRSQMDWCQKMKHGIINVPGSIIITPWSKLKFEEVDFGWGKPTYVVPPVNDRPEYVLVLSNCKKDGGVDVFIAMEPEKMTRLEEFLKV